jgi:hypothetical protein
MHDHVLIPLQFVALSGQSRCQWMDSLRMKGGCHSSTLVGKVCKGRSCHYIMHYHPVLLAEKRAFVTSIEKRSVVVSCCSHLSSSAI